VRLLLDTHAFLWWDAGSLEAAVCRRIQQAERVFVSAATAWEIAIKAGLGKIVARSALGPAVADYGFDELPITVAHADAVRALPPHHGDPFDRILVAQALQEGLVLVSRDPALEAYAARVVWG
jgi:PIN domain nuclease of toxin-antitoxin system